MILHKPVNRRWLVVAQAFVSVALLVLLIQRLNFGAFRDVFLRLPLWFYLLSLGVILTGQIAYTWRWGVLLEAVGTTAIRTEFGKAYDLRVVTYLIWSFYSPTSRAIAGAKSLGIDLLALGFDTQRRHDLITNPEALFSHVMNSQEQACRTGRFALALEDAGREMRQKFLA